MKKFCFSFSALLLLDSIQPTTFDRVYQIVQTAVHHLS